MRKSCWLVLFALYACVLCAPVPAGAQDAWRESPPPTDPTKPAIARGGTFFGFPERFNRYYTDPAWRPSKTLYVSPDGGGDGTTRESPLALADAIAAAGPGTMIYLLKGAYSGCYEISGESGGTYDAPIVFYGERNEDGSIGASIACCTQERATCLNFEASSYIAVDGLELSGGNYGVRAVGAGYPASQHSLGIAVLNCTGHDQEKDPFFTGQSDWAVFEKNVAFGAKPGDGHGIYLSNGSDWNIVRFNETYSNDSSDFQINADPHSACEDVGIAFDDPVCDAYAGEGEGGQGASDYFLVDGNYFHHSIGPGPNFTSVRRSLIRNNIFGPQARHNVSFWQETDNPKLGASDNRILHNLFITTERHGVQFVQNSTRNLFANNVLLGIQIEDGQAVPNPRAVLMEVDETVGDNVYLDNLYISGVVEGRAPGNEETTAVEFSPAWLAALPLDLNHDPNAYTPMPGAPWLNVGEVSADAPTDRNGTPRGSPADLGPIELP